MAVARLEAALEVEVISWRMGACGTTAVEVDGAAGAGTGAAGGAGFAEEKRKVSKRFSSGWPLVLICSTFLLEFFSSLSQPLNFFSFNF